MKFHFLITSFVIFNFLFQFNVKSSDVKFSDKDKMDKKYTIKPVYKTENKAVKNENKIYKKIPQKFLTYKNGFFIGSSLNISRDFYKINKKNFAQTSIQSSNLAEDYINFLSNSTDIKYAVLLNFIDELKNHFADFMPLINNSPDGAFETSTNLPLLDFLDRYQIIFNTLMGSDFEFSTLDSNGISTEDYIQTLFNKYGFEGFINLLTSPLAINDKINERQDAIINKLKIALNNANLNSGLAYNIAQGDFSNLLTSGTFNDLQNYLSLNEVKELLAYYNFSNTELANHFNDAIPLIQQAFNHLQYLTGITLPLTAEELEAFLTEGTPFENAQALLQAEYENSQKVKEIQNLQNSANGHNLSASLMFGYKANLGNFGFITEAGLDLGNSKIGNGKEGEIGLKNTYHAYLSQKIGYYIGSRNSKRHLTYLTLGAGVKDYKVSYQSKYLNIDEKFTVGTYFFGVGQEGMVSKNISVFFEFNHIIPFKSLETQFVEIKTKADQVKFGVRYYI